MEAWLSGQKHLFRKQADASPEGSNPSASVTGELAEWSKALRWNRSGRKSRRFESYTLRLEGWLSGRKHRIANAADASPVSSNLTPSANFYVETD